MSCSSSRGAASTGEEAFFRRFPEEVSYHVMGEGFTWETQDRQRDIAKAEAAWKVAAQLLADPDVGLVVLDELNIALKHGYLELDRVLADIQARPAMQHVVVTGRGAAGDGRGRRHGDRDESGQARVQGRDQGAERSGILMPAPCAETLRP